MFYGDDGSKLVECFPVNQSKIKSICIEYRRLNTCCKTPGELALTEGGHEVDVASGLYLFSCEAKEWTGVRLDGVR